MGKKIRGNHDGPNGENQSYSAGTKTVSRKRMADAVDAGLYPGYHTVKVGRKRFVRANPDGNTRNNVDQG